MYGSATSLESPHAAVSASEPSWSLDNCTVRPSGTCHHWHSRSHASIAGAKPPSLVLPFCGARTATLRQIWASPPRSVTKRSRHHRGLLTPGTRAPLVVSVHALTSQLPLPPVPLYPARRLCCLGCACLTLIPHLIPRVRHRHARMSTATHPCIRMPNTNQAPQTPRQTPHPRARSSPHSSIWIASLRNRQRHVTANTAPAPSGGRRFEFGLCIIPPASPLRRKRSRRCTYTHLSGVLPCASLAHSQLSATARGGCRCRWNLLRQSMHLPAAARLGDVFTSCKVWCADRGGRGCRCGGAVEGAAAAGEPRGRDAHHQRDGGRGQRVPVLPERRGALVP